MRTHAHTPHTHAKHKDGGGDVRRIASRLVELTRVSVRLGGGTWLPRVG